MVSQFISTHSRFLHCLQLFLIHEGHQVSRFLKFTVLPYVTHCTWRSIYMVAQSVFGNSCTEGHMVISRTNSMGEKDRSKPFFIWFNSTVAMARAVAMATWSDDGSIVSALCQTLCTEALKFNFHRKWPYAAHFQTFRLTQSLEQREKLLSNGDGYSWSVRLVRFWTSAVVASQITWTHMPDVTPGTLVFIREREEWWQVEQLSTGWPPSQRANPYWWAIDLVEWESDRR